MLRCEQKCVRHLGNLHLPIRWLLAYIPSSYMPTFFPINPFRYSTTSIVLCFRYKYLRFSLPEVQYVYSRGAGAVVSTTIVLHIHTMHNAISHYSIFLRRSAHRHAESRTHTRTHILSVSLYVLLSLQRTHACIRYIHLWYTLAHAYVSDAILPIPIHGVCRIIYIHKCSCICHVYSFAPA